MEEKINKTEEEWQKKLSPQEYQVTRKKGTERAFTGKYYDFKEKGNYHCICCGNLLFSSETKYDSGSGWPSFWQPENEQSLYEETDNSLGIKRVEVLCQKCNAHLGHVFEDGPPPTGLRYCINSCSLDFKKSSSE